MPVSTPLIMLTRPDYYDISYAINPWMDTATWAENREANLRAAKAAWQSLSDAVGEAGGYVLSVPGQPGLPDMVYPANSAIVLNRRALRSHFRYEERQKEESYFKAIFENLQKHGFLDEIGEFPEGVYQEGAGDCVWDSHRQVFWAGFGPRSNIDATNYIAEFFQQTVVALELVDERLYHMDVCLNPLPGGELVYYPGAFSPEGLAAIESRVPSEKRIVCTREDAEAFGANLVCINDTVILARGATTLCEKLIAAGYRTHELDLDKFILSGGAAFCMSLRLDQRS